jgi:hypothetical protein
VHALAHGELGTALQRNPLTVLAAGVLVTLYARWVLGRLRAGTTRSATRVPPGWLVWVLIGLVFAFGVLRNLPGVSWLGPGT